MLRNKIKLLQTVICLFVLSFSLSAFASNIEADHLIWTRIFENPGDQQSSQLINTTSDQASSETQLNSYYQSEIAAKGSLETGQVGTIVSSDTSLGAGNSSSRIEVYDTLNFSTEDGEAATVTLSLGLDGTMSVDSNHAASGALSRYTVTVHDITGLDNWIQMEDDSTDPFYWASNDAVKVAEESISFFAGGADSVYQYYPEGYLDEVIIDLTGATTSFDLTKALSFEADPDAIYGIRIIAVSSSWPFGDADIENNFFSTGTLEFTDLDGATYTSGSGVFLGQSNDFSAPVPEPTTMLLFGFGLLALTRINRKRE